MGTTFVDGIINQFKSHLNDVLTTELTQYKGHILG